MKLLLDQGLPRLSASLLRESGIDVIHTAECGLSTASDAKILEYGLSEGRAIVTLDADFHTILAIHGASGPSVVRIRIQGLRSEEMAPLIEQVLDLCASDLEAGAAVSVGSDGIRIRQLPFASRSSEQ